MKVVDVWKGVGTPKVRKYPLTAECTNPELVIGFELETESCIKLNARGYEELVNPCNFTVHTDGSLRGLSYEFISRPMRSDNALAALKDFFLLTQFTEENYSDRCSVHVHVNCTDITLEEVSSVALLYTVVEELLFEFVGGSRDTNIYCIPWNQCRAHYELVSNFLSDPSHVLRGWNKYTALNLIPLCTLGTVEFRQMHGTADINKLTTWVNIIGALFKYAKAVKLKDLIGSIKTLNTTSHYEMFFNEVLGGQLPYNEVYRQKLEEGVVLAKYSLVNYSENKRDKKSKEDLGDTRSNQSIYDELTAGLFPAAQNVGDIRILYNDDTVL